MAPRKEFTVSFNGGFTAADAQSIRDAHRDYSTAAMMTIAGNEGSRVEIVGSVLHDGEHVTAMLYFAPNSQQPDWTLAASSAFTIDCTGGSTVAIRSDDGACDAGLVQQWTEDGVVWTLSGQTLSSESNPIQGLTPLR